MATGSEPRRAVLMVGGRGRRLRPHTEHCPKPMVHVCGRPLLEILLAQLVRYGFTRATLCLGHLGQQIRDHFGDGSGLGLDLDYVSEDRPLGTAGPLRLLPDFHEQVLVANGDLLTELDFGRLYRDHAASDAALTIATCQHHIDVPFGVLEFEPGGQLRSFQEKPRLSHWVSMGVYVASPGLLQHLPERGPCGIDELVQRMLAAGAPPRVHPFDGLWLDIARSKELELAEKVVTQHQDLLLQGLA